MRKPIIRIFQISCIVGMIFFGYKIYELMSENKESIDTYNSIVNDFIIANEDEESVLDLPVTKTVNGTFVWDYKKLLDLNKDGKGYIIQNDGEYINNPIVQGSDNSWYLKHTVDNNWNKIGSIFMDSRITDGFNARNLIIYGHNMSERVNHIMFGSLNWYYNDFEYYKEHKDFDIYTEDAHYKYYVCAIFKIGMYETAPYQYEFSSDEEFLNYVNTYREKSCYQITDVPEINKDSHIITLSTCASDNRSNRLLVQLVRGERID